MSGVYWGIVASLVALVAVFFVCMDLVYSSAKGSLRQSDRSGEGPSEPTRETPARDRYAA
jgi:p-aminobenzoyl-glutamate transporter AbgT